MVEGDQGEEEGQGTGESPDLAVSEMEDYGALDGMKVGICYFFVYYFCWIELNWLFNVTINDISVIYVTATISVKR